MTEPREGQLVLAVDLGTGGPKVGFVSVTGDVAWQDHFPVATRWLEGGGAVQDADEWWTIISDAVRKVVANGVVAARGRRRRVHHRSVGQHGSRRRGRPSRR